MRTKLVALFLFLFLLLPATASAQQSISGSVIRDATLPAGKLAPVAAQSLIGNCTGSSASPTACTALQVKTLQKIEPSVFDYGAVDNDAVDNAGAAAAARAAVGANRSILVPQGDFNLSLRTNLYGTAFKDALGEQRLLGTAAAPATRHEPIYYAEKITASDRNTIAGAWDQGLFYGHLNKRGGNAYAAAITGFGEYTGGSGDLIGVHGRVRTSVAGSRNYAGWFYVDVETGGADTAHAAEFNGRNTVADPGYGGLHQLVRLAMADSTADVNRFSTALSIGKTTTYGGLNGFWQGINIERDAIIATPGTIDDGEAIAISGPAAGGGSIGGIRYRPGVFKFALRTDEATFDNSTAIALGAGQRLRFNGPNGTPYLSGSGAALTLTGGTLTLAGDVSASAWGINGVGINTAGRVFTDTSSAGTVTASQAIYSIAGPTIKAISATTYSGNYATLRVSGAPIAGDNVTLSNARALHVTGGSAQFDEAVSISGSATVSRLSVSSGFSQSGGLKHGRAATGSVPATSSALVTLTWAAAFADASYTATCSVADSTAAAAALRVVHLESVTAAAVAVRVENTSIGALSGTLHCIAMHD